MDRFLQDASYRTNQAPYEGRGLPFSGRIAGSTLSHLGPPTAPSNTASAALQASIVSSVKGTPYASIDAPPAFLSIN